MNAWIGVPLLLRERKDQAGKPGADTRKETCRNRPRKLRNWNGATCLVKGGDTGRSKQKRNPLLVKKCNEGCPSSRVVLPARFRARGSPGKRLSSPKSARTKIEKRSIIIIIYYYCVVVLLLYLLFDNTTTKEKEASLTVCTVLLVTVLL